MDLDESSCQWAQSLPGLAGILSCTTAVLPSSIPVTSTATPIQPRTNGSSLPFTLNTCTSQILNSSVTTSVLSALPLFISLLLTWVLGLP